MTDHPTNLASDAERAVTALDRQLADGIVTPADYARRITMLGASHPLAGRVIRQVRRKLARGRHGR